MRTVLGVDPGLASTGYGIVQQKGSRLKVVRFGVIRTDPKEPSGARLLKVYDELQAIVGQYNPDSAGIESLYQTRNITSAIPVAQARGVVLLALAQEGIPASEYTPQAIKLSVVGTGGATKEQVQRMVQILLGLEAVPSPDHAADALAAAVTHLHTTQGPVGNRDGERIRE